MNDWDEYWEAFAHHVHVCPICHRAGGVLAPESELCPEGGRLHANWRARLQVYLQAQLADEGAGGEP